MQYLSLRLIFLCVFLPPVLYLYTLQITEWGLQKLWIGPLEQEVISDPQSLLLGEQTVKNHVARNVDSFFNRRPWVERLGISPSVHIQTEDGLQVYPPSPQQGATDFFQEFEPLDSQGHLRPAEIASQNLELLQRHFLLELNLRIERDSWLATGILAVYIFGFSGLLLSLYVQRARKAVAQEAHYQAELAQAHNEVRNAYSQVEGLREKEAEYTRDLRSLQHELVNKGQELQGTEEEALLEMERLERKLKESEALREDKERELLWLKKEAQDLHVNQKQPRASAKKGRKAGKRLVALYTSIHFDPRAIQGFSVLPEDMQIRAEKCFTILHHDSRNLPIKRKIFNKKGNMTVFESDFAYRGRVYWRQKNTGIIQIIAIGTKNSQDSDIQYINSLCYE